jgi:protein-S-isoprenylcysteine O-methyltransferase Ste14
LTCSRNLFTYGSGFSFAAFALYLAGFYIHVHFVEERELIQRFGDSYSSYRRETPAFFVSPGKLGTLLRFLAGKGKGKGKSKR